MGDPHKESADSTQEPQPADDFFAGPQAGARRSSAELSEAQEFASVNEDGAEAPEPVRRSAAADKSALPPEVRNILLLYVDITKRLLMSPIKFFKEMERSGGYKTPGMYLAISAAGTGATSALMHHFNLGLIPREFLYVGVCTLVTSGLCYMMAKSMGSKASFEAVFRVLAYCSCLSFIGTLPGIGFIAPLGGLVYNFFGLREVLSVSMYQTITIMFLVMFMQVLLAIGHMLG